MNNTHRHGILRSGRHIRAATIAYPLSTTHPLGPPMVSGTTITVDTMLQQPTRVTRMIMDLTLERFVADRLFASGGGVTGGAVVYDEAQENELYTNRDIEQVSPAAEFPLVTSERLAPKIAEVEKWGGKTFVTDEARDRNDTAGFTKLMRQLANTITRKLNQRAVAEVNAALADGARDVVGNDWSSYNPEVDPPQSSPAYDFGRAQMQAETEEMGIEYNLWIVNPQEALALTAVYGATLGVAPGIPSIYSTPRQPAGEALACAERQLGQMRIEKPLGTETWREQGTERTWVQSSVRPLWFVDNKFAVLRFTGLAG